MNLNLEKDAHYRVSFDYSGEPQHHRVEYVMSAETDPNSRITFDCGGSKVGGTYSITIENLVITKVQ